MKLEELLELIKPKLIKGHGLKNELVVSLTSYPNRFHILPFAIQSILNQTVRPDKVILWLYKDDYWQLPATVRAMERLGLQILLIDQDWKSYKKIIPSILNFSESYILTCDDDILYKPTFVEELVVAHGRVGGTIAQRAHLIQFDDSSKILPYREWLNKTPIKDFCEINSPFVFPTSGGGVLYPPNTFDERVVDIEKALDLCPTADDIWLYFMATLNGNASSLIGSRNMFDLAPNNEDTLWSINSQGANDRQLANLISEFGMPDILKAEMQNTSQNAKQPNTVKLRNGTCIRILDDHIGSAIKGTELYYECDLITFIKQSFSPKSVIDVGANIGNHAIGFSGHPEYRVICFEPDPDLAQITKHNLEMNSIDYELHVHGLGQVTEKVRFVKGTRQNSGIGRFDRGSRSPDQLLVKRLDDCVGRNYDIDVIKIDVEGFELDVLLGAKHSINRTTPVLIIEHQDYNSYKGCKDVLCELGYVPLKVFCATPTFIYVNSNVHGLSHPNNQITWVDCWDSFTSNSIDFT